LSAAWQGKDAAGAICLILSGWINPLVLLYLPFCVWASFLRICRILAAAIMPCIAATWAFFFKATMFPLIGHFTWIAGILLIVSPKGEAIVQDGHNPDS